VARQEIPIGTALTDAMVDRQPWPRNLVLDGFITADSANANVAGKVARADFKAREPLLATKLASKDDASFLAAALPHGMRAVTLAVDQVTGVAGYVFPGDRVDVILTHSIGEGRAEAMSAVGASVSEVVLADVRVLAVNSRKSVAPADSRLPMGAANAAADDVPANITVEVSQHDVQRLRLAEKNGSISLALRPAVDNVEEEPVKPVALDDITALSLRKKAAPAAAPAAKAPAPSDSVNILRGGIYGR
jgi:pilus assembly protein CpaB